MSQYCLILGFSFFCVLPIMTTAVKQLYIYKRLLIIRKCGILQHISNELPFSTSHLTGNKFGCDCRLAWMLHLENATRNEKFRRELRHIKCNLDGSGNVNSSSKVTRLTPTQLGCPKDYTTPELTSTTTSMGRKTTWASSGSHVGVGRPENANRIEEDVVELPSKDMEAPVEREKTMKNEIEVVLNQQKNVEKVSAPSRKHSGNSASVLWKSLGHQVFCLAVALALVVAR